MIGVALAQQCAETLLDYYTQEPDNLKDGARSLSQI